MYFGRFAIKELGLYGWEDVSGEEREIAAATAAAFLLFLIKTSSSDIETLYSIIKFLSLSYTTELLLIQIRGRRQ
jgi:hypothetical protein